MSIYTSHSQPTAILSEEQILQLKNDNVTELHISLVDKGLNDTSIDWAELGQIINTNNNLKKLFIQGDAGRSWKSKEKSRQLFKNIAANTSIDHLSLVNLGTVTVISLPPCIKQSTHLRCLEFVDCEIGSNGYDALAKLLKHPDCNLEILVLSRGDFKPRFRETVRDALATNTSVKKLHIEREYLSPIAWTCRNSAIEELTITHWNPDNTGLTAMGNVLKDNTTLKKLKLCLGQSITVKGWATFAASLRNNNTLVELDFSNNSSFNDECMTGLMNILASNTTLSTLRLENLGQVTPDGWRSVATIYLQSPTCVLESLYMGKNIIGCSTFREFVDVCENNKILKNLCLRLPSASAISIPRLGWNPWMNRLTRIVYNKRSIMDTYNSNHVLETICYPREEERFARDMSTCELIGKNLPTYLLMNRSEQDKFALARKKIMEAHFLNQAMVTDNMKYRGYKTLMDTILQSTDNMEKTQQLPNIMAWIGRDNDGLQLMYELIQRMPTLCESFGRTHADTSAKRQLRSSKRKRND